MPLTYFRPRGDIKSNWELANPILKLREMGIEWETTVGVGKAKIKFGDGVTAWNNLNYAVNVASQIQSDTKSNWTSNNPVLGKDEMGIEWGTTVGVGEFNIKVGDGTTAWNDLAYGLTSDITNKAIKTITEYSGNDENPALADGDTLSVAAGKLNEQQTFLKNTLGYERLATMAETLGGLSNKDFMGVMEKLNSIKFNKTDVYNGTDSTSTSLAASANALKTVKDLTDTNTSAISQLNSDMQNCYQLSGGIYIPENADMKSSQYLIPGNYYCNSVNVALTLSNCPFKSAFLLKVEWSVGSNAKYIRQTFIQYDNNRTISRVYFDNEAVWQDETQFITNADFAPLTYNDTPGDNIQGMIKAKAKIIAQNMSGNICGLLPGGWQGRQFGFTLFGKANNIITLMIVLQHDTYTADYNASNDTVSNIKKITTTSVG